MILVSSCLLGNKCNYKGEDKYNEHVINYLKDKEYIAFCPECLGKMNIPRVPSEILHDKVLDKNGKDVTSHFILGADKSLFLAKKYNATIAILKAKSPSCGSKQVYDGTFTSTLIEGEGYTAKKLKDYGIIVYNEVDIKNMEEN